MTARFGAALASLLLLGLSQRTNAQDIPAQTTSGRDTASNNVAPGPVLTGGMSFGTVFSPGTQVFSPVLNPIFLVPFGRKFLFEAELAAGSDMERDNGTWQPRQLKKEVEYLQLDYMLNKNTTLVAGRILTPFGIYMERYHPDWIRDLQIAPMIFGISHNQSMGAELRGATHLMPGVDITYTGYYGVNSTTAYFDGQRGGGGRTSLFFSKARVETGFSYSRRMGDDRFNLYGWDFTWNAKSIPLDIRAEAFKTGVLGDGYWVEGAYRLNKLSSNKCLRNSQIVARGEQYFAPSQPAASQSMNMPGSDNFLPDRKTTRYLAGWNYLVNDAVRLTAAYGRSFATEQNQNIYSLGVTYRFTLGEK
jgi:hypothetical protein